MSGINPEEMNEKLVRLLSDRDERDAERSKREEARFKAELRWNKAKIFLIGLIFVIPILSYSIMTAQWLEKRKTAHVAVVELRGEIHDSASVTRIVDAMEQGMKHKHSKGLIIDVDTPGGSPAQSERMRLKIEELIKRYPDKKVECVGGDLIASGGYLVASGCQKITVLPTTLTGSIGVIHQSFGMKAVAEKLNVEVRTITAGKNKAFLSQFEDLTPEHRAFVETLMGKLHGQFIDYVRRGRGDRLKETEDTFSGYIWTGPEALEMGLVDGIGTLDDVVKNDFDDAEIRYYGRQTPLDLLKNMQVSATDLLDLVGAQMRSGVQFK